MFNIELPRYLVAVVVHSINEVDDTLGCCSQVLFEPPVICFTQPASIEADGQPQSLLSNAQSTLCVDSNAFLKDSADSFVNSSGKLLCEIGPQVSDPVVAHELQASCC